MDEKTGDCVSEEVKRTVTPLSTENCDAVQNHIPIVNDGSEPLMDGLEHHSRQLALNDDKSTPTECQSVIDDESPRISGKRSRTDNEIMQCAVGRT